MNNNFILKNTNKNVCNRCNKNTWSYSNRNKEWKCSSCNFILKLKIEDFITITMQYDKENLNHFIIDNIFKKGNLKESKLLNIFSMEIIKKHQNDYKLQYEEVQDQKTLKDFESFYLNKAKEKTNKKWYEFTSYHDVYMGSLGDSQQKIIDKISKIKNENNLFEYQKHNLVYDFISDPFLNFDLFPELKMSLEYAKVTEVSLKKFLTLNKEKYLFKSDNPDINKGFNNIYVIKFSIKSNKQLLLGSIWDLKTQNEFEYELNKEEINNIFNKYGLEKF